MEGELTRIFYIFDDDGTGTIDFFKGFHGYFPKKQFVDPAPPPWGVPQLVY